MASETSSDSETEDMPALEGLANVGQPLRPPAHTPGGGTRRLLDAPQHEEGHGAGVAAPEGGRPAGGRTLLLLHHRTTPHGRPTGSSTGGKLDAKTVLNRPRCSEHLHNTV